MFQKFDSGAIRSTDANATSYFLISPIGLLRLAKITKNIVIVDDKINVALENIRLYLSGDRNSDWLAAACFHVMNEMGPACIENETNRAFDYTAIPMEGLRRLAATYREGELKYSAYNCELGLPIHDLLNHALKHLFDYIENKNEEDDLGHATWNLIMAMHSEEMWPHLNTKMLRAPGCTLNEETLKHIDQEKKKRFKTKAIEKLLAANIPNTEIRDFDMDDEKDFATIMEILEAK